MAAGSTGPPCVRRWSAVTDIRLVESEGAQFCLPPRPGPRRSVSCVLFRSTTKSSLIRCQWSHRTKREILVLHQPITFLVWVEGASLAFVLDIFVQV
jgi:hypothetical protein